MYIYGVRARACVCSEYTHQTTRTNVCEKKNKGNDGCVCVVYLSTANARPTVKTAVEKAERRRKNNEADLRVARH